MAGAPQPSELIYTTEPSWLPMFTALGLTLAIVGIFGGLLVPGWFYTIAGAIIFLRAVTLWVRKSRRQYHSLPREQRQTSAVLPPLPPRAY